MKILLTGGAGYIGSTVATALIAKGHIPVLLDSLVTGPRVFTKDRIFYEGDIADRALLEKIFSEHPDISHTIHFAARIIVPESVSEPYLYYIENVYKSIELFKNLADLGCSRVVFSSSAAVYGSVSGEVTEDVALDPQSPYANTKYMMEMALADMTAAMDLKAIALRYFNPIGSDPDLVTGVHVPHPSHVLGKMVDTAIGKLPQFQITGTDWPTRDGSGIRDYIDVWDLANAHVSAVEEFDAALAETKSDFEVINIGTGNGVTVKELVAAFERAWGSEINKVDAPPRPGDIEGAYANADKAKQLLKWQAERTIDDGIQTALAWTEKREAILGYK